MTKPIDRDTKYRGRRFQTETIVLCVRWYIRYRLSYCDSAAASTLRLTAPVIWCAHKRTAVRAQPDCGPGISIDCQRSTTVLKQLVACGLSCRLCVLSYTVRLLQNWFPTAGAQQANLRDSIDILVGAAEAAIPGMRATT